MSRKLMIAGNWKLNNTVDEALALVDALEREAHDVHKVDVVVAPVFTAIKAVSDALGSSMIHVAAQNAFWEVSGAFTGEVSAQMVREAGARLVIIGHSERRRYFGETDETVNKRIKASLEAGLKVIVCIGETLQERESQKTYDVLDKQIAGALDGINPTELEKLVIAYEPVWAIGTGKTATPDQADEAHKHIRKTIAQSYDQAHADGIRILYGGSMKPGNAQELLGRENIDGGLIGGASLKAVDFLGIIRAGEKVL